VVILLLLYAIDCLIKITKLLYIISGVPLIKIILFYSLKKEKAR